MPRNIKDENGRTPKTDGEVSAASRNRTMRTFNISEEENEAFCEETERRVEEWTEENMERLTIKESVEYENTPEIKAWLLKE